MMCLLLGDDGGDRAHGGGVMISEQSNLLFQVAENDALDCRGGRRDRLGPEQAGHRTKHETAHATEPVAATAAPATTLQLGGKDGAMPLLV